MSISQATAAYISEKSRNSKKLKKYDQLYFSYYINFFESCSFQRYRLLSPVKFGNFNDHPLYIDIEKLYCPNQIVLKSFLYLDIFQGNCCNMKDLIWNLPFYRNPPLVLFPNVQWCYVLNGVYLYNNEPSIST